MSSSPSIYRLSHTITPVMSHGMRPAGRWQQYCQTNMGHLCNGLRTGRLPLAFVRPKSTMPAGESYVKRLTLFKIPKEEDIDRVLKQYEVLKKSAVKDGKPYITSSTSRRVLNTDSPLSEGFTLASQSLFRDKESHDFYDQHCPAHKELKKVTAVVSTGKMTIVTEGEWPEPRLQL